MLVFVRFVCCARFWSFRLLCSFLFVSFVVLVFVRSFVRFCLFFFLVLSMVFSGYSKTTEARMCEAYVTLGRLSHVKMRHEEDTEKLRAVLEERVGGAFKSALEKVRGDVSAFGPLSCVEKKSLPCYSGVLIWTEMYVVLMCMPNVYLRFCPCFFGAILLPRYV